MQSLRTRPQNFQTIFLEHGNEGDIAAAVDAPRRTRYIGSLELASHSDLAKRSRAGRGGCFNNYRRSTIILWNVAEPSRRGEGFEDRTTQHPTKQENELKPNDPSAPATREDLIHTYHSTLSPNTISTGGAPKV